MSLRIVHVCRQFLPATGGVEKVVHRLALEQIKEGHSVGVITLNQLWEKNQMLPEQEMIQGISVHRVPYLGSRRYAVAPGVLKKIRDYDIVHLHSSDFFLDFLSRFQFFHRKKLFLSTHGLFFHTDFLKTIKAIHFQVWTRLALKKIQKVFCVSQLDYKKLLEITEADRLEIVPNGIDWDQFVDLNSSHRDPMQIVCVGRLAENKNNQQLLQVFSELLKKIPSLKLEIIGPDAGDRKNLERLVDQMGIGDSVRLRGRVSQGELVSSLHRAKYWVSASQFESFGIALLEAMAAGCIPIVNQIPAFKELIVNGKSGFLTDFSDMEQTVLFMEKLIQNPEKFKLEEVQKNAVEKAKTYQWSEIHHKMMEAYQQPGFPTTAEARVH